LAALGLLVAGCTINAPNAQINTDINAVANVDGGVPKSSPSVTIVYADPPAPVEVQRILKADGSLDCDAMREQANARTREAWKDFQDPEGLLAALQDAAVRVDKVCSGPTPTPLLTVAPPSKPPVASCTTSESPLYSTGGKQHGTYEGKRIPAGWAKALVSEIELDLAIDSLSPEDRACFAAYYPEAYLGYGWRRAGRP
jgi:hypothetical protein